MTDKTIELDQHRGMAAQKATELQPRLLNTSWLLFIGTDLKAARINVLS